MSLIDLGEHRLRDLSQPQRLYQVQAEGLKKEFSSSQIFEFYARQSAHSCYELPGPRKRSRRDNGASAHPAAVDAHGGVLLDLQLVYLLTKKLKYANLRDNHLHDDMQCSIRELPIVVSHLRRGSKHRRDIQPIPTQIRRAFQAVPISSYSARLSVLKHCRIKRPRASTCACGPFAWPLIRSSSFATTAAMRRASFLVRYDFNQRLDFKVRSYINVV